MAVCGVVFLILPHATIKMFSDDPVVIILGSDLLAIAAVFQIFDGIQAAATGALRGLGDTHTPLRISLVSQWGLSLPCGYVLAFPCGWGIRGLWIGLSIGLVTTGVMLVREWRRRTVLVHSC